MTRILTLAIMLALAASLAGCGALKLAPAIGECLTNSASCN